MTHHPQTQTAAQTHLTSPAAPTPTPTRRLGATGPEVGALGLGCMGMSPAYGAAGDRAESIATLHAALEAGVTLLDTGDFYGMGHNELLIGEALRTAPAARREQALLSVKFGSMRGPDGAFSGQDGRPAAVKNFAAYSLQRLGVDHIDVYRISRLDPQVPIEETVGAVAELVEQGYVRHIGLSEVGAGTIRRAAATAPIADLQFEYSLLSRSIEAEILPTVRELGIAVTAYGVLAHGLISDHFGPGRTLTPDDFRAHTPRFQGDNLRRNLDLAGALRAIAADKGITLAQTAIAWALSRGADIVPVIGARTRERLTESLGALDVTLDAADLAAIEAAIPEGAAAGDRYPTAMMADLER
ncbi:aldo/keto reductase [Streptomyces sp. NPDC087212]|uniref:aldo/keto reductase n=1 Tax=Streptomyces sp. NPDC087212 TaxID=3365766 RepID=UPI0037F39894